MLDTYYIYDIYGNLKYALSPMASAELTNRPNGVISSSDEALQKYAFAYEYGYRNRCISKKLPGAASIYMVYDMCDQLIYTQDGNQRARSEWTYFVYDKLGRLAYSGTVIDTRQHKILCYYYKNISLRTEFSPSNLMYGYTSVFSKAQKADVKLVNYYDNYSFLDRYPTLKQELNYVANDGFDAKYVGPDPAQSEKGLL
ncbi:MAG: RHS repeat-associated core domain-containing protein, partial [Muribaculaceae bacterium]